jgi:hypothetical protein
MLNSRIVNVSRRYVKILKIFSGQDVKVNPKCLKIKGSIMWNNLPNNLKSLANRSSFCSAIKPFLLMCWRLNVLYRLCFRHSCFVQRLHTHTYTHLTEPLPYHKLSYLTGRPSPTSSVRTLWTILITRQIKVHSILIRLQIGSIGSRPFKLQ